jgi:hypothetical protein
MLRRSIRALFLTVAVFLAAGSATVARGQTPVTDIASIVQSIMNTGQQLQQWYQDIQQARQAYALAYAAYSGVKDWRSYGWMDALQCFELPWFDGIDGIDDVRNLASATGMSVQALQGIFKEVEIINRMKNDKLFMQNQAYQARMKIWSLTYGRVVRRRIALTRMSQQHQKDLQQLQAQEKTIQSQIENLSQQDPPPMAAIQGLQARLAGIQAKINGDNYALQEQIRVCKESEKQDLEQAQSDQMMAETDPTFLAAAQAAQANFWDNLMPSGPVN